MQVIDGDSYTLYLCAIESGDKATRRSREQAATAHLVAAAFGSDARKCNDAMGAPYIESHGVRSATPVSLSHSHRYAVLAVGKTGARIGVDVEEARAPLARVVRRVCTLAEWAAYGGTTATLLAAWTAKEALYKACRDLTGGEVDFATMLRLPLDGAPATTSTVGGTLIARYALHTHTPGPDALITVVTELA